MGICRVILTERLNELKKHLSCLEIFKNEKLELMQNTHKHYLHYVKEMTTTENKIDEIKKALGILEL